MDIPQEILNMLKTGRIDEIMTALEDAQQPSFSAASFPVFMEDMLREHHVSRKKIALRAGLSQDYTYKLLRGDKHTTERDYIIAICMAAEMTFAQTQHALSIYGMPVLSTQDPRSYLIIRAIQHRDSMDTLNDMLEHAGFPILRTSPELPKAPITSTQEAQSTQLSQASAGGQDIEAMHGIEKLLHSISVHQSRHSDTEVSAHTFEELESWCDGHPNGGNAPFDYDWQGWIRVQDETGQIYQVEAVYSGDAANFIVFTDEQRRAAEEKMLQRQDAENEFYEAHKDVLDRTGGQLNPFDHPELFDELAAIRMQADGAEMLESYNSLEEAARSAFFPFFLELEKMTDRKVIEVLASIDDTRNYGSRIGMSLSGGGANVHMEAFNHEQPERREYYQIVMREDGTCRYTASHESCFMRLEMGSELYETIFGKKSEPVYFIDTEQNDFAGEEMRYQFIFRNMQHSLHTYASQFDGLIRLDPDVVDDEKIKLCIETGVGFARQGQFESSLKPYTDALDLIRKKGIQGPRLIWYLTTLLKLAYVYSNLDRDQEMDAAFRQICDLRPKILEYRGENADVATSVLTEATLHILRKALKEGRKTDARPLLDECLDLIENHGACADNWRVQFEVTGMYAFQLEDEDLDKAVQTYRKALAIAQNHHLDQDSFCAEGVAIEYNNLAWVLWNLCDSEEAIFYYGRSLELLESYLASGILPKKTVLRLLDHAGDGLLKLYKATNRKQEAAQLKKRLRAHGVKLV